MPGFEEHYAKVSRYARWLRAGGYVGIALDVGQSGIKIHEACTIGREDECARTKYREGGRLAGSVFFGGAGAWAAYGTCNLLLGPETLGTSLLWCGIVFAGAGGYMGSQHGGQWGQRRGDAVYEYIYRK